MSKGKFIIINAQHVQTAHNFGLKSLSQVTVEDIWDWYISYIIIIMITYIE